MGEKSKLGPVRRIVTGHNEAGRAIFRDDDAFDTELIPSGDAEFTLIWTAPDLPVENNDETDGRERDAGLTLKQGSVIRVVDMLPGGASPMHRTSSLDYGIVMSGELELELDDGEKTLLGPGDIVIQRGTMHLWRNPSETEPCRIVFVLTQATPVEIDDEPLPEVHP